MGVHRNNLNREQEMMIVNEDNMVAIAEVCNLKSHIGYIPEEDFE